MMFRNALLTLAVAGFILAPARGAEAVVYSRHVQAVFSRLGCNGGTCHGAVQGQNGLKLSLFGADPARDLAHLQRDEGGRRINLHDPVASLLLLKATGTVSHQGGKRTNIGSPEYEVLRRWLAAGAPGDGAVKAELRELRVAPLDRVVKLGETYPLTVEAVFTDGTTQDVTGLCAFESLDPRIATVDAGMVTGKAVGDAAILVRYRSTPALALVLVPRPGDEPFPAVAPSNFIDTHILAKLRRLNLPPSQLAGDAMFLRRACLDVTGELPSVAEVRAFLADADPAKREKKIDELLARPGHAALWTLKFGDLLKGSDWGGFGFTISTEKDAPRFQAWIRARLEENLPYDQFVERILTATSREGRTLEEVAQEMVALDEGFGPQRADLDLYKSRKTLDLYWQRNDAQGVKGTIQVAHAFLGLRLECAQCHRHPADVWQQDDLLSFANFFMRVRPVGGNFDATVKRIPGHQALGKSLEAESKKLGEQIKQMRESEGKKLEAEAKAARAEADKLTREITKLEQEAARLTRLAEQKPAEAATHNAKKVELLAQVEPLRVQIAEYKQTIAREDEFKREVGRLDKRSKAMGNVTNRLVNHELHLLGKDAPLASVTSPLGTQKSTQFRLLGQTVSLDVSAEDDPRTVVMAWLRRPDNPYFARAIVNRVWAHYFGRGIVDPPDNLSPFNPATHPELLTQLAAGFIRSGFDLKWLHRTILGSRTYQQDSQATAANEMDRANYAFFAYRRLPAEVLLDVLDQATGTFEKIEMPQQHWPTRLKAVEMPYVPKQSFVAFVMNSFGKPNRNSAVQCDCERDPSASMLQVLTLANHPQVWAKVSDATGRAAKVAKDVSDDNERIDELYLAVLSRFPTEAERGACQKFIKDAATPAAGAQGILWGLLNTREFLLQH